MFLLFNYLPESGLDPHLRENVVKKIIVRVFPGGPVVRTLRFHCCGSGLSPRSGNQDPTGCAEQRMTSSVSTY